jgi:hypothetical protein
VSLNRRPKFRDIRAARVLLETYYLPGDLENRIGAFAERYNHEHYHESLGNVTPADVYFNRATALIERRNRIKKTHHRKPPLEPSAASRLTSTQVSRILR